MSLSVFRSPDERCRTELYPSGEGREFALAEKTTRGVLLSRFSEEGELLDQVYKRSRNTLNEMREFMKEVTTEIDVVDVERYNGVEVNATCTICNTRSIKRELDLVDPRGMSDVAVVPLFVCTRCGKKFYSMNERYLARLVSRNLELFESSELSVRGKNELAFMKEVHEYIIRIFASKRIMLMKIDR